MALPPEAAGVEQAELGQRRPASGCDPPLGGDEQSTGLLLIAAMVPVGAGMGLAVPTLINLVLRAVPTADAGAASGMLTTAQQIGNALGVAIVGSIFFAALGPGTGAGACGDAFAVTLGVQALLALASAALLTRAREPAPRAARVGERV